MYYENKTYPKEIKHIVSLTAEDIRLAIKAFVRKEHPNVPPNTLISFTRDMCGCFNADVTWTDIEGK